MRQELRELKENASQSQSTEVEELRQKLKKAESEISQINSKLGTTETKLAQTEEKLSKVTKIKSKLTFNQTRFFTSMSNWRPDCLSIAARILSFRTSKLLKLTNFQTDYNIKWGYE